MKISQWPKTGELCNECNRVKVYGPPSFDFPNGAKLCVGCMDTPAQCTCVPKAVKNG